MDVWQERDLLVVLNYFSCGEAGSVCVSRVVDVPTRTMPVFLDHPHCGSRTYTPVFPVKYIYTKYNMRRFGSTWYLYIATS